MNIDALKKKIAATVSCHAAIKINTPLDETKMRWLVGELMKTDVPTVCPHGRPIILRYDLREIERASKEHSLKRFVRRSPACFGYSCGGSNVNRPQTLDETLQLQHVKKEDFRWQR